MYNLFTACGNIDAQTSQLIPVFVLHNRPVHKTPGLYLAFERVVHNLLPTFFEDSPQLLRAYARNTQDLLQLLLIYLKKGY